jgi:hypothetical protein
LGGVVIGPGPSDGYQLEQGDTATIGDAESPGRLDDPDPLFDQLDQAVVEDGLEALAWFHPFHQSRTEWGIYVPITSIHYCAKRWFDSRMRYEHRANLALEMLLSHEVIHFACEYAVAQYEILLSAACWEPARDRLQRANLKWFDDEEAVANANCIRTLRAQESSRTCDRLHHELLLRSPRGYRDFPQALSDEDFADYLVEVLRHNVGLPAADLGTGFLDAAFDHLALYPDLVAARGLCPLFFVDDSGGLNLPPLSPRIITCIPDLRETLRFRRKLQKLARGRQEEWALVKTQLTSSVPRHRKFKKLQGKMKGLYGLYLSDGYRVHLRPGRQGAWEALDIGTHNEMGHG